MRDAVVVEAPSRAHLGLLQTAAAFGRQNMGFGFAVANPAWRLRITPAHRDEIAGDVSEELRTSARLLLDRLRAEGHTPRLRVEVMDSVPTHIGLGSKTAFLCSVLAGGRAVANDPDWEHLRGLTGRGGTSGIGINTIVRGGVILDVGHAVPDAYRFAPSSLSSGAVPAVGARWPALPWPIAIVVPTGVKRFSGADEARLFDRYLPVARTESEAVAALTLFRLIPALATGDYDAFAASLADLQTLGFKACEWAAQDPLVRSIRERLLALGADCVALSSVGPAMIVLAKNLDVLLDKVLDGSSSELTIYRSASSDRGLVISNEH